MNFTKILGLVFVIYGITTYLNGRNKISKNNLKWISTDGNITKVNIQSKTKESSNNEELQLYNNVAIDDEMVIDETSETTNSPQKLKYELNRLVLHYAYVVNDREYESVYTSEWTSKNMSNVLDTFDKNSVQTVYYNKDDFSDTRIKKPVKGYYYSNIGLTYFFFGLFLIFNKCVYENPFGELRGGDIISNKVDINYTGDSFRHVSSNFMDTIIKNL